MGGSVLKTYVKTLAIVAGLGWAGAACAVGFGNANVNSALGQPLKIEIAVTSVNESDRNGMTARLASPDAFKAAGLEYPYHLSKLKFDIAVRNRQTYILVTSKEPVNDSFINILVELNWPSGKLLREYTFLLDPPDYKPDQSKPEPVAPIEPVVVATPPVEQPVPAAASSPVPTEVIAPVEAASAPVETVPGETAVATPVSAPEATATGIQEVDLHAASGVQPSPAETQTTAATQPSPAPTKAPAQHETIAVKRGDTLSKIAAQIREPDMTLEQMVVALYRANANKFDGKNMNRIRTGKILTIPESGEYEQLSQKAAVKEIRIQTANWRAYRQKLAAAGTTAPEQAPTQATGGKISTTVADKTPQPKEPANGKLVLSKGETPGDKTVAGGKQASANAAKEEAIAKEKQAKEEKERIAMLEQQNKDAKKAIELKGGAPVPASTVSPVGASPVQAASGVHKAQPKPAQPTAPVEEKSFLDDILDMPELKDPVYLGGAAGVLLLLVGGGFYLKRRNASEGGGSRKKKR
jgi:pilus assembly protein FimV